MNKAIVEKQLYKNFLTGERLSDQASFYYQQIKADYDELKKTYPYSYLTILPTIESRTALVKTIAIDSTLIKITGATENDLMQYYSKVLWIEVPENYKKGGCIVYGGTWIDDKKIPYSQKHFYGDKTSRGYRLCVGVPLAFEKMENVLLENVKTADHILTAYADYLSGRSEKIILKAYSHGEKGINEYKKEIQ